ncbi:MAG: thiamine pyrophosphate-dependent enzyme [Euryarchaeota archaeon]|nr:thiamine pyrophosphate-dependent enzyme [Euryarchaeota archaeon]
MSSSNANSVTGLEALYLASVDSKVELVTAVAGFPVTSLMDHFVANTNTGPDTLWMTNEKVALETALGASVAGRRALVLSKHVGMNVLCDPLVNATTHTIGAGVVIIAGDDPGVIASQNEQDSRWFGELAEVAVYDPATPDDAYRGITRAFELSEMTRTPVIVRITHRLEKASGPVDRCTDILPSVHMLDRSIWDITMKGKHQRFHLESYPVLVEESEMSPLNRVNIGTGTIGIISSGYPSSLVEDIIGDDPSISHLSLNMPSPVPMDLFNDYVGHHERILVVEETEPFIESHIYIDKRVRGKRTGHLPYGRIEAEHIRYALDHIQEDLLEHYTSIETINSRGSHLLCEDCPYLPLYNVLRDRDADQWVAGDIGCSVLSAPAPLHAVDTGFSLGSAISVACGFKEKGIAVIGDFGLAHSGIVGLINAVHHDMDVLVIVLQNKVAAMTGGQDVPDLIGVVEALCDDVTLYDMDRITDQYMESSATDDLKDMIKNKLGQRGPAVIVVQGRCPKYGN